MDMGMDMGMDTNMPGAEPGMNNEMPMGDEMENMDSGMPSEFDSNFDAGVEADEESDPKTYIQQLTGKLSQSLNSYNNENGEPDVELGKYVLGMLIKQGVKGMDDKDKKEIIKKINTDDTETDEMPNDELPEETPSDEMQMESKTYKLTKKQLFENFGIAMSVENTPNKERMGTKITSDTTNRRARPFRAPKKFK